MYIKKRLEAATIQNGTDVMKHAKPGMSYDSLVQALKGWACLKNQTSYDSGACAEVWRNRNTGEELSVAYDVASRAILSAGLHPRKKNEADDGAMEVEEIFAQHKDDAAEGIEHLADIIDSFQPTDKEADAAKLALIDYIKLGVDNLVSSVEKKLGLKKNG